MIYFKISKNNEIIIANLNDTLLKSFIDDSSVRKISHFSKDCDIELFATEYDYKLLSNKHIASKTIESYSNLNQIMEGIKKEYNQEYTILSHNLITSHSLLQDALGQIVPEESLSNAENHIDQINIVKDILLKDNQGSAESILSISKRVVDLQAQIEGFKILSGNNKLDIGNHNIKKILQNILYPFYEDFNNNHVQIRWHIDYEFAAIKTDYKILNVALHHFFNNAVKYTMPYSYIDITYEKETRVLSFSMMSIKIEKDELEKIFDLRYRGKNVNIVESGEGVGMYMVKRALNLLRADIKVEVDYNIHKEGLSGIKYTCNKFSIQFN